MNDVGMEIKRWTAKRKVQVVLDILKGKTTVVEVSRQHDLTPAEVESRDRLLPVVVSQMDDRLLTIMGG